MYGDAKVHKNLTDEANRGTNTYLLLLLRMEILVSSCHFIQIRDIHRMNSFSWTNTFCVYKDHLISSGIDMCGYACCTISSANGNQILIMGIG